MSLTPHRKIEIAKPYFDEDEKRAVAEVIVSGWISQGPKVKEFEKVFADYVDARYAVAVTSCTTALHLSLVVSGIKDRDEVIVPSLSFIATANAVIHAGAVPVFVDIDPETCNIAPEEVERSITDRTRAVIPVHQMGLPADLDAIKNITERYNLRIIEDAACAVGSEYKRKRVGGHGNIACFSFHPRKVITTGEGGMITTDDPEIVERLVRLRHHGMSVSDLERHNTLKVIIEGYPGIGFNYRMTDMQAAIGLVQMKKLPKILDRRRVIAARYNEYLSKVSCLRVPNVPYYAIHNYQSFWVELLESSPITRNRLMQKLLEAGISTRRGIMAIHKEPCYSVHYKAILPNTERITRNTLILPLYPSMTDEEVQYVIDCIGKYLS